jgi:hypothetical protein
MAKKILVKRCCECPENEFHDSVHTSVCLISNRRPTWAGDSDEFPKWCRLEDYEEGQKDEVLRKFVRWIYREQGITFTLANSNRDDLDERAAVALVDRFLMSPEDLRQEKEELDEILQRGIAEMGKKERYHG